MTRRQRPFRLLLWFVVGVSLLLGALPGQARDRDDKCEKRVRQAEQKLNDAVRRHGEHSKQAHKRREQLEETRKRCGDRHDRDHDHH